MIKLALRVLVLTVVLEGASLVFAEEAIITLMILFLIALCTASLVMNRERAVSAAPVEVTVNQERSRATTPAPATVRSFEVAPRQYARSVR